MVSWGVQEALQLKDMDRLLASETNFSISEVEKLRTLYQRQLDDEVLSCAAQYLD